ncbi:MAG: DUF488 domain-containing protein [Xanthomonadales bacterium]|nr:DUF488 domain-containing protein [Xanthomonadales bacterium]
MSTQLPIFTIGHSSRPLADFLDLLEQSCIECVIDVRRLPGSNRFPQYNADALSASLAEVGMAYQQLPALCGRRTKRDLQGAALETFWTNASFAIYAAYARSEAFTLGLDALLQRARRQRCTLMCSEAVWWRCHRRIITDHLLARGEAVCHIMGPGKVMPATLTRGALIQDGAVIYPPP